ncbi:Alpha-tectorin [Labeo rohita]|uniref:Alpha-tectorin n=1 Tax=Labeo rohita TaxID=84645 RepID=A0ABQ8M5T2_LABRO|nr:Alpha-tectorin [Labeo rohita]
MRLLISLCFSLLLLVNCDDVSTIARPSFTVSPDIFTGSSITLNPCAELSCTEDEWCGEKNGVYGCLCNENQTRPDSFDFSETCESSSGSMSVSRCQLFEAGFSADVLHLNDPSCKGMIRNGRVEFHFDNNEHICGTNLVANGTHFIYDNFILGKPKSDGLISREKILKLPFSCVYPQSQTLSMNVEMNPLESIVHKTLPAGEGRYQVRMIPYEDDEFTQPYTGRVDAELDQKMNVEVRVEGVDSRQFALVIDACWATPVNDPDYSLRWDLIVTECPSPNDDTVELLQNGVSTSSRFSFRMFIFTANSTKVYLHCAVHLCLLSSNHCLKDCNSGHHQRERRSLDFHDSASISMGPLMLSEGNTDKLVPEQVKVSAASCLCASLMLLLVPLMSVLEMPFVTMRLLISLCVSLLLLINGEITSGQTSDVSTISQVVSTVSPDIITGSSITLKATNQSTTSVSTTTETIPSVESITPPITTTVYRNPCSELACSENERCGMKNGVYGCLCNNDQPKPQPDSFDFSETCESSSGSMSLSRCQLFEAGFSADVLHLNDLSCKGTIQNGRVDFHFDNDEHICGTNLVANGTHFIYSNFILGTRRSEGLISREKILKLSFSCVYPQTQTLSMNVEINPLESIVHRTLPAGEGRYQVRMIPYEDDEFTRPFTGKVDAELNQKMNVEVHVEGVDNRQFALVMDTCWATPVNDPDYSLRWDLIINECPNPNDDTVKLLQNGVSTSSRFSFRMFIFTANNTKLYLHCAVHLCLLSSNRCSLDCNSEHYWRERRSLDFHDSASISVGPLVLSEGNTDKSVPEQVKVSEASCLCASLMLDIWQSPYQYYYEHDDTRVEWSGWYRLYLNGESAQMSEWCLNYTGCGGNTGLPTAPTSSIVTLFWGNRGQKVSSAEKILKLSFSCVYPQTQTLTMDVEINPLESCQFALVMDTCWATPDMNDPDYSLCWDLIINDRFSFRMFIFTANSTKLYLHCAVHICLLSSNHCSLDCNSGHHQRERRSLHDSASISMGPLVLSDGNTESTTSRSDPCYNYNTLDEYWRDIRQSPYQYSGYDDTLVEWSGWYRLYLNGESAQMSEWCVSYTGCGGYTGLYLNGSHPTTEDGVVTHVSTVSHAASTVSPHIFTGSSITLKNPNQSNTSVSTTTETIPSTESFTPPTTTTVRSINITGPFYPFGTGDTVNERSDDGSSLVIYLQQPFIFFGQTYNTIYVNNNGHLTFDGAWGSFTPYQFPAYSGKDLIAPFWTDIDNRWNGVISYQQYTSGSVLTQATQDINQYFPDLSFSASWVFVATWDRVAYYYNSGTETSFQVVLVSNGHRSYVLMNYGAIAPTNRYIQVCTRYDLIVIAPSFVTYSSNVNVPGRWAFRTDHGSRGCHFNGVPVQLGDSFWSDAACQQRCTCTSSGLQCSHEPCSYSQACRPATFQYSCQNIQRQTCTISGDPHYYTFDYQVFHFQGTCTYVLSEACGIGLPYYRIEGKNEHRGSTHVSWTRMVRVFVYDEVIELVKDHSYEARVNGSFAATPFTLRNGSIQVYQSGFSLAISTDFGLLVTYDAYSYVSISVPYDYFNATCGLCGNFNLHPEDDYRSPSGEILSSDVDFANSWKVESDTDPECHNVRCTGLACAVCTTDEMTLYSDSNHCGILEDIFGPFAACHSVHAPQTYIENCVYDLCLGGGYQPILCQALNVYATQCQQQGKFNALNTVILSLKEQAVLRLAVIHLPNELQESCICDPGYILSAGECVPEANCGCIFEGFYYAEGQSVVLDGDCGRRCECSSMLMTCHQHHCGPAEVCGVHDGVRGCRPISYATCSVEDLGSYHTFDGLSFRYPGACGLTLARVMGSSPLPHFVLTVEKVPRGLQDFSRFLKFEAEGIQVSIEMGEGSNVKVDGQMVGLPVSVGSGQIRIYHSGVRGFVLETTFGVTVRADWPHIVRITAPGTYSGTLGGLCGNLNGDISDEFYTPDGVLLNDTQLFADSWRDGSLSAHCVDPLDSWEPGHYQNSSQFIEHCSIMAKHDGPFAECSRAIDPQQRIIDCVQLLEQTQGAKEALCEALRDPNCPANTHYEVCGTSCPASCPSLSFPFQCTLQCQEGCQCNDGNVLNGDRCVPPTGCGCYHSGRYRQAGERFWHGEECQFLCVCDGITGNVHCTPSSCSEEEVCHVLDGEYGCHPRPRASCSASGDPHYKSFDGTYFDFQGTCRYVLATVCNDSTGLPHFQVDARNEPWHGLPVSITVEVFVNVSGHLVHMSQDMNGHSTVEIDGETRNLPLLLDSGRVSVYSSAQYIFVSTDFGFSVSYGGSWTLNIIVPAEYSGATCGICGNFNGQSNDDFMTPSGDLVRSADQFGASWKVEDELPCNDGCGNNCPLCQDQTTARSLCEIIRSSEGPFSFCHVYVDPQAYFDDCVFDVCLSGNLNDVLCRSIQTYVSACQSNNAVIYPWREIITCPENSHYELCGTDCGHTCASSIDASCEHTCSEGCFCDDGLIGEQFWDSTCSQRCQCFAPNDLRCSASSCPPAMECQQAQKWTSANVQLHNQESSNDPTTSPLMELWPTFRYKLIKPTGTCSYEIAQTCGNVTDSDLEFRVVATNRHRGNMVVSFVSAVDVWLSQHGQQTHITIGQNRRVKVDGNAIDTAAYHNNDLVEIHEEQGFIILNAFNEFIVHFDGHSSLLVRVSERFYGSLCGMCGNFNGNPADDKVLRSGDPAPDDDSFGHSWKSDTSISGCGAKDRTGNIDECPSRQRYSDLCSIITNTTGPFQNCHLHVDPAPYYYSCVYDLCLYTRANGMLCSAVEAYQTACVTLDVQILEWRSGLRCDVRDRCSELSCSEDEWCGKKNGVYGCLCNDDLPRPQPDSFDFSETCESSSGSMSVSRCQLFEAGFPADVLHLNDPSCKGMIRNGRVDFHFDNDEHICGTNLLANGTHFIYSNFILGTPRSEGLISREKILKLSFSCVYPQSQTLSMHAEINPLESVVHKTLPAGEGRYQVRMIPYEDDEFTRPFTGKVDAELNQKMNVEVRVEGVDSRQFALVMDTCWATPVNDPDYSLRWDLIINECPNPNDDTVELLQNGVSTSSRFSFRMFIFTANSTKLYLHCAVHLCLLSSNHCSLDCNSEHHWRGRRSLEFHDSASISMGPLMLSDGNTDKWVPEQVKVSEASCLCASLMLLLVPLMSVLTLF